MHLLQRLTFSRWEVSLWVSISTSEELFCLPIGHFYVGYSSNYHGTISDISNLRKSVFQFSLWEQSRLAKAEWQKQESNDGHISSNQEAEMDESFA